jgi:hypothetical protein
MLQDMLPKAFSTQLRNLDTSTFSKVRAAFGKLVGKTVRVGSFCSGCEMEHWAPYACSNS